MGVRCQSLVFTWNAATFSSIFSNFSQNKTSWNIIEANAAANLYCDFMLFVATLVSPGGMED
jgi:hypothetical protein